MGHRVTTLNVNTIEPAGNTLTIGASGDTVVIGNNDIRANTYKDAGGNTLFVSDGSGNLSSVNSAFGGSIKLISTTTVSSATSLVALTSGLTSTYKEYIFKFINIHPGSNSVQFQFHCSIDGGSNYNLTQTSVNWYAIHQESDATAFPAVAGIGQSTNYVNLSQTQGYGNDESMSGELHLYNPASTTFAKLFWLETHGYRDPAGSAGWATRFFTGGYMNTTSAINAISFKYNNGNVDSGKIKMYGVL